MNFVLFLLLNAVLLLRPEELIPSITGLRLYLIVIVACVLTSFADLARVLSPDSLRRRPIAVCVLLFFASTIVSLCVRGRISEALFDFGPTFAKVILYYFLFIAVVDTEARFRAFVGALVVFTCVVVGLALAQMNGVVDIRSITPYAQKAIDPETGEQYEFPRMVSSGIFNDPNDLCLLIGLGILSCVYLATTNSGVVGKLLWLLPLPVFFHGLLETHSRGGLLGVLAGGAAYVYSRFGGPKALPFAVGGAIVALVFVGGRQAEVSGGTARARLMFWADGVSNLLRQPQWIPTGLGMGWFVDEHAHVAHNSFIQAYVELGLLGGGAFLGAFLLSARILDRFGRGIQAPPWVVQARPYGFAVVIGYAMGCYSLTRNYVETTYLILGLASVLVDQARPLPERYRVSGSWFGRGIVFALGGLAVIKLVTQGLGMAGV